MEKIAIGLACICIALAGLLGGMAYTYYSEPMHPPHRAPALDETHSTPGSPLEIKCTEYSNRPGFDPVESLQDPNYDVHDLEGFRIVSDCVTHVR